jgi:hypothetical protein
VEEEADAEKAQKLEEMIVILRDVSTSMRPLLGVFPDFRPN